MLPAVSDIALAGDGSIYFTRVGPRSAWRIRPDGEVEVVLDVSEVGPDARLSAARGILVDAAGDLYVAGYGSNNVFKVTPSPLPVAEESPSE